MSKTWKIPEVAEREYEKAPSIWVSVVVYVVVQIAGILITVLTWEQGKPVMSGTFFLRALGIPLLLTGILCALSYVGYESRIENTDWWNFLCREERARWRRWAQGHIPIIGSVALTPEVELAERLLGLEGSVPMNPGKVMPFATAEVAAGRSRVELILEQLLMPFASYISRFAGTHTFHIVLQSVSEQHLTELRALLRKLELRGADLVTISQAPLGTEPAMIGQWLADKSMPDFCLLLACQLHEAGTEPSCSEVAVGMLLASADIIARYKGKVKPQARLFRPIFAASDSVFDSLSTLLAAVQTPTERIKHLWFSHLPRQGRHATEAAVKDAGLQLAVHDVDHAIGKPGPANALLLQALAAQMVEHGQGAQLLASPRKTDVMLNLIAAQVAPVPDVSTVYYRLLSLSMTIGFGCNALLFLCLLDTFGVKASWPLIAVIVLSVLMLPIQIGGAILNRRLTEDDFYRRLRHR
jgi:hypothetical protein